MLIEVTNLITNAGRAPNVSACDFLSVFRMKWGDSVFPNCLQMGCTHLQIFKVGMYTLCFKQDSLFTKAVKV